MHMYLWQGWRLSNLHTAYDACQFLIVRGPDPTRMELKRRWRLARQRRVHLQQECRAQQQFRPSDLIAVAKTLTTKLQVGVRAQGILWLPAMYPFASV